MKKARVLVAMSGGVDSSVAAARLFDAGFDVVGCTLHLWDYPEAGPGSHARCCAPEDQYDARRVADALGFPHFTFDRRELFAKNVVAPFVEAYVAGETPSPCTACNRTVKLGELMAIADKLGAEKVATGHYARVDEEGRLYAGRDANKDQSYFLYATPPAMLRRMTFPLGESTKEEVRAEAIARKLPGATKGESQELCFVGEGAGAYAKFVEERAKDRLRPGPIVDQDGRVVGKHEGIHKFTVGQRKGLGVALGAPAFVTRIDAGEATVHVGGQSGLRATSATLRDVVLAPDVTLPREALARVRYRHSGVRALAKSDVLEFLGPPGAVSPGQVAVLYDGERVLGGGVIANVRTTEAT
ncbi:MAG TPA: tRNA 2-thiouridine(34) synthase MnmA [Polyangiaceae bacterium]|jgi:tRNA-specific 2-thiouridylase